MPDSCQRTSPAWSTGRPPPFDRPIDASSLEPTLLVGYPYGQRVSGAPFLAALALRNRVARSLARYFDAYDILLSRPCRSLQCLMARIPRGAETLDGLGWIERTNDLPPCTMPFNVAGTPAMTVPVTADAGTGLSVGMQFAAGHGLENGSSASPDNWHRQVRGQGEPARVWAGDHRSPQPCCIINVCTM